MQIGRGSTIQFTPDHSQLWVVEVDISDGQGGEKSVIRPVIGWAVVVSYSPHGDRRAEGGVVSRPPLVHILIGLPGSGKTHWAREQIRAHLDAAGGAPEALVRLSRDDLRAMMTVGYGKPIRGFEDVLTAAFDAALTVLLMQGSDVILDETNLNPRFLRSRLDLIKSCGAQWRTVLFTHVPLETCIARDAQRTGSARVGEQVIRDMHARYLASQYS